MSRALTAGAPAPVLLAALARAGYGPLRGREWHALRAVLRAVVAVLPSQSGTGQATACQIADAAGGYSERWTRAMLGELEALGLIAWTRGGVVSGKPQPSLFRLSKRRLLALIHEGRAVMDQVRAARAARTTARLAGLRMLTVRPRQTRRSVHAELGATPPPYRGRGAPSQGAPGPTGAVISQPKTPETTTTAMPEWFKAWRRAGMPDPDAFKATYYASRGA